MGVLNEPASRFPIHPVGPIPEEATGAEADARRVALRVRRAGGRALVVGGYVRDRMLGLQETGEPDLEVFGLGVRQLERALRPLGKPRRVGRAFPVLRVGALEVEIALPRRESKTGPGHLGFEAVADPNLSFPEAARRRDLTLNAMGLDPLSGELLDPFSGASDLEAGVMRATDSSRFPEDPLRGLRVAAFAARYGFTADDELTRLSAGLDLSELSQERVHDELLKLLLGKTPSAGFRFLARSGLLRFLPEVAALVGVPQDPEHHPEGDVFEHTLLVLDQAALAPVDAAGRPAFLFAALCHDLGKPATTRVRESGRITSWGHDAEGAKIARGFLERLRAPRTVVEQVEVLTRRHLAPALFPRQGAKPAAYPPAGPRNGRGGPHSGAVASTRHCRPAGPGHSSCPVPPVSGRRTIPGRLRRSRGVPGRGTRCGSRPAPARPEDPPGTGSRPDAGAEPGGPGPDRRDRSGADSGSGDPHRMNEIRIPRRPGAVRPTTWIRPDRLGAALGLDLTLASETFQRTGSFKFRAALPPGRHGHRPGISSRPLRAISGRRSPSPADCCENRRRS